MRLWTVQSINVLKMIIGNGNYYNIFNNEIGSVREVDKDYFVDGVLPIHTFASIRTGISDYLGIHAMSGEFYKIAEMMNLNILRGYIMIELEVPDISPYILSIKGIDKYNTEEKLYCNGSGSIDMAIEFYNNDCDVVGTEVLLHCIEKEWLIGYYSFEKSGNDGMLVLPHKLDCKFGNTMLINTEMNVNKHSGLINCYGYQAGEHDEYSFRYRYGLDVILPCMTVKEIKECCTYNICSLLIDYDKDDVRTIKEIIEVDGDSLYNLSEYYYK